jgi:GWxTD domain-containing protein
MVKALNCSVDVSQFKSADKNYLDINLRVEGGTCKFISNEQGITSSVLVTVQIKFEDAVVGIEKYKLNSGIQSEVIDMLDMRRFFLDPGMYNLEIQIVDDNDLENVFNYKSKVIVKKNLKLSNALILSKIKPSTEDQNPLVRNNVYMEAQPYMVVHDDQKTLSLYQEIYTEAFDEDILIHKIEFIKEVDEFDNGLKAAPFTKYQKISKDPVVPVLATLDLNPLPSGRYKVVTSILDKKKRSLATDALFVFIKNTLGDINALDPINSVYQNTFVGLMDSAEVVYALKAIVPITNYKMMSIVNYVIEDGNFESQKYYLHKHWNEAYPGFEEQTYSKYMEIVRVVDEDYNSSVGHGFQTDRGYIYLKYGKPNKFINVIDEPNTPPYEIWYYNHLEETNQPNVRFIFFDPLQVNNYELLHSTCFGEKSNEAWETILYKFNEDQIIGHRIQATEVEPGFGRRAKKLFNDF